MGLNGALHSKTFIKLLSEEEETALFLEWREAKTAKETEREKRLFEKLVLQYTPIINKLVKKMSGYANIDPEDLFSEGLLALVSAVDRFDPSKGFRFSTFARAWIEGMMYTFITRNHFITNVCTSAVNKKLFFSMRRIIATEIKKTGLFDITPELVKSLMDQFSATEEDVLVMNNILRHSYDSLDEVVGSSSRDESGITRGEMFASNDPNPEEVTLENDRNDAMAQLLNEAMAPLKPREKFIFQKQMISNEDEFRTLEILGNHLGISKERVRQIRDKTRVKVTKNLSRIIKGKGIHLSDLM